MNKQMMIYFGCLVVVLGMLSVNVLAEDLETAIVASRIMPGDNASDNSSDLCLFSSDLNLLNNTADVVGHAYNGVAAGTESLDSDTFASKRKKLQIF